LLAFIINGDLNMEGFTKEDFEKSFFKELNVAKRQEFLDKFLKNTSLEQRKTNYEFLKDDVYTPWFMVNVTQEEPNKSRLKQLQIAVGHLSSDENFAKYQQEYQQTQAFQQAFMTEQNPKNAEKTLKTFLKSRSGADREETYNILLQTSDKWISELQGKQVTRPEREQVTPSKMKNTLKKRDYLTSSLKRFQPKKVLKAKGVHTIKRKSFHHSPSSPPVQKRQSANIKPPTPPTNESSGSMGCFT
jgi:murein L,D-transpeptidase YcbB/YkuD